MGNRQQVWRRAVPVLFALAFIGALTFWPDPKAAEQAARVSWTCLFPCGDRSARDAVLNVILFVPLGLALRRWLPGRPALLLVMLSTVSVEFTQYHWLLGRDPSLRDILTNTAGGALGIWLAGSWPTLLRPSPGRSARLALITGAAWLMLAAMTGALIRPSLPSSIYWGQWAPELGQFDTWQGTLLDATVNSHPLPKGRTAASGALRSLLLQDSVMIEAKIVTGPAPRHFAPIASVFDSEQREIFVLGQRRNALAFGIRTGLRAMELGNMYVRMDAFTLRQPGDTMLVSGGVVRGAWVLRARHGGTVSETHVAMSPALMWSALFPFFFVLGPATPLISAAWLGATIAPTGYFAAHGEHPTWRLGIAVLVAVLGYTVAALAPGLPVPSLVEYTGTVLGLAGGWFVGRRVYS